MLKNTLHFTTSLIVATLAISFFAHFSLHQKGGNDNADAIIGVWKCDNINYNVELYKEGDYYDGKIIWMKNPSDGAGNPIKDKLNPQRNLREKTVLGMINMSGFEYNQYDNIWEEGTFYNPETGQTVKGIIKLKDNNTFEMTGFLGFALSEIQMTWTRVETSTMND